MSGHLLNKTNTEEGEVRKISINIKPQPTFDIAITLFQGKNPIIIEFQEIPYHLSAMEFGVEMDGSQDFFQMFWPVVVSHKIDDKEPLLDIASYY